MSKPVAINSILKVSLDDIIKLRKNITIRFDDGVSIHDAYYKEIILFRFLIRFLHKYDIPITSEFWISNFYSNGYFSNRTYLGMYSLILKKVVTKYISKHGSNDVMVPLFKDMYETLDIINHKLNIALSEYMCSFDIFQLLEIQFNKELILSMVEATKNPTPAAITHTYNTFDRIIREDRYKDNVISLFYLSGMVSESQMKQLLASRGYVTELNSKIFSKPMTNSFTLGFKNVYEATIESRAGAKALELAGKAIQNTEYTNREMQIATMVVEAITHEDCGKPVYNHFYVKGREVDERGIVIHEADINNLVGKYYFDEETKTEKIIGKNDEHLIGKFILLRQAIYCGHRDKKKICTRCIGQIGDTIFTHDNLGVLASSETNRDASQGLLSAKHLLKTAVSAKIKLLANVKKFFMVRHDEFLYFKANIINKKIKKVHIKVRQNEAWGLDNIMRVKDIFSINVNKISRISEISLVVTGGTTTEEIPLTLKSNSTYCHLSMDVLSHIIRHGYTAPDEEHYLIDINDFNSKKPVFVYDKVEFSLASLNKEFKATLKTRKFTYVDAIVRSEYTPDVLVQNLYDLLNSKLSINIALIEIIVYAFTVKDLTKRNYDLGRGAENRDVVGFKGAIDGRSVGASYNWDDLQNKVLDPLLYIETGKPDTPMDVFFKPAEVIKHLT